MRMIEQLATVEEPEWLSGIDSTNFREAPFPLKDILRSSLYYPSAGFDGDPVRYLAGNVVSFVFVDYGKSGEELAMELADPGNGFRGYEVIASRPVTEQELTPNGWNPSFPSPADGNPSRHREWMKSPFCSWNILQRLDNFPESHGPHRFSLLYLCAEGVAAFQALYVANRVSPAIVAVIQPGHGFGKNWTNFEDPEKAFARSVTQNPSGKPKVLLFGGIGPRHFYREPCWPDYSESVCFLDKAGEGSIGVWRHAQQHAADATDAER
jgi:hypothetical protein